VVTQAADGGDGKRLQGAWRYVDSRQDGKSTRPSGVGMIYYGTSGEMICHVSPGKNVQRAGAKPTPEEALAVLDGHVAYFGTYSIDETAKTVTHHRKGSMQPGDLHDLVRRYRFEGNRLILNPPGTTYEVTWERFT
jgi:Lipocalin-like domain